MEKGKKHEKPVDNFNEALIKYIIESAWYPNTVTDGGGAFHPQYGETIGDARTYREARNRILQAVKDGGIDYLKPAIRTYNLDHGSDSVKYSPESYNISASKMEPIKVNQMQLTDVDATVDALARLLNYNDNGKENGARNAFLEATYGGDGILKGIADAHSFEGGFNKEGAALSEMLKKKFSTPMERARIKRELGFAPSVPIDEVFSVAGGLPSYAERSYRAYARNRNLPAKAMSVAEGFVAPQVAASMDEGRNPNFVDIGTDAAETYLLGSGKIAKKVGESVLKKAGIETGLDIAHDAANDFFNPIIYSEGEYPIRSRDYSDLMDPSRAAYALASIGMGGGNKFVKNVVRKGEKVEKKAIDKSLDKVNDNIGEIVRNKQRIESEIANISDFTRMRNRTRKKFGQETLSEKQVLQDKLNELKDTKIKLFSEKRKRTALNLFGDLARIGTTRGMYNEETQKNVKNVLSSLYHGNK